MPTFTYSVVSFVPDSTRTDRASIAVIVLDPDSRFGVMRRLRSLRTVVSALSATTLPEAVERTLTELMSVLHGKEPLPGMTAQFQVTEQALDAMSRSFVNQIQFSAPRKYQAQSLQVAAQRLTDIHLGRRRSIGVEAPGRARARLRARIDKTLSSWELGHYRVEKMRVRQGPSNVAHQADFWLANGRVEAAVYALADSPDDISSITLRDSLPVVLDEFRSENPAFRVIAVSQPESLTNAGDVAAFLENRDVRVIPIEQLDERRAEVLPDLFGIPSHS